MRNLSLSIVASFILISFPSFSYAQQKERIPSNEQPAIRVGELKVSRQANSISITTSITNASDATTGQFDLFIIVDGQLIDKQQLKLSPHSSKPVTYEWQNPTVGEHLIKVIADPDGKLNEPDRSDNNSEIDVSYTTERMEIINKKATNDSLLPAAIDLLIENISVQGHRFQQDKMRVVTINFKVMNHSSTNETKSFRTQVDITSETGFKKIFNITTNSIGAGQSAYISCSVQNAPHRFDISIKTDADNAITESNENNNSAQSFYENPTPPVDRWISVGPDIINGFNNLGYSWASAIGRLSTIAIHPDLPQIMYVGGHGCGIWKTLDGGTNWFPLTDQISVNVASIALSPVNANQIFWVTEHQGVYRSDDAGLSWTQISMQDLSAVAHNGKLLIHPRDPNIMLVRSENGIYRSGNGGVSWTLVVSGAYGTGLEINDATDRLYCAVVSDANPTAAGIFESVDRGISWRKLDGCPGGRLPPANTAQRIGLAISGSKIYAAFRTATGFQLYRTTNLACSIGGVQESSWEKAWGTTTDYLSLWGGLWANPLDENDLYLGGTAFWRSTNKGNSFSKVSDYGTSLGSAHADHHGFAVLPGHANTIFTLNDGGIYRSTQNGNEGSWSFIGKGIANIEFYDFADAFSKIDLLIGGTQDNGILKTEGSLQWQAKRDGDGATVEIDNTNANIIYSLGQYATSLQRSVNGGDSWANMFTGLPEGPACLAMRYQIHPRKANILLASCTSLWRITDPAGSWQTIFTPSEGVVTCSAVEPTEDLYLAATSRGKLFGGINGSNFQQLFSHPFLSSITDVECDPDNLLTIFLGCAGSTGRVYMLKKTLTGTYNATDITGNLPTGVNVKCIAVDRMNSYTIYAGSSKGVYRGRSFNQGQTWEWSAYMDGLPLADITDLEVHPVSGVLTASTFGRSIFEVSTDNPIGSVLAVEGKLNYLRVHDVDTKFGPPNDVLDAEAIVQLDSKPGHFFGLQLRPGSTEVSNESSIKLLRTAFESNLPIRIEYIRNGIHSGKIIRVILKN